MNAFISVKFTCACICVYITDHLCYFTEFVCVAEPIFDECPSSNFVSGLFKTTVTVHIVINIHIVGVVVLHTLLHRHAAQLQLYNLPIIF